MKEIDSKRGNVNDESKDDKTTDVTSFDVGVYICYS